METSLDQINQAEKDEEYILLDLENVCMQADIPANAPYTLFGLDTLNPTLTIGNRLKLIGEYQETIGTCILFCQRDDETVVKNTDIGRQQQQADGLNEASGKQFRDVASVHKVLKFRLADEVQAENVL